MHTLKSEGLNKPISFLSFMKQFLFNMMRSHNPNKFIPINPSNPDNPDSIPNNPSNPVNPGSIPVL